MKIHITFIILFLFFSQISEGQTTIVKGQIRDNHGLALSGASLTVDGQKHAAIANMLGYYTLILPGGRHDIEVSFVGFSKQKLRLTISKQTTVIHNFIMIENYKTCKEVVVVSTILNNNSSVITNTPPSDSIKTVDIKVAAKQIDYRY